MLRYDQIFGIFFLSLIMFYLIILLIKIINYNLNENNLLNNSTNSS